MRNKLLCSATFPFSLHAASTALSLMLSMALVLTTAATTNAQQVETQVAPMQTASAYAPPPAHQERVIPDGTHTEERTNWSLVGPGIGLLAGGWALGWFTTIIWNLASTSCTTTGFLSLTCTVAGPYGEGYLQMAIPIVGPWISFLADDTFRGSDVIFPIFMGIMQPVGLGLLIAGLVSPKRVPAQAPTYGQVDVHVGLSSMSLDVHF